MKLIKLLRDQRKIFPIVLHFPLRPYEKFSAVKGICSYSSDFIGNYNNLIIFYDSIIFQNMVSDHHIKNAIKTTNFAELFMCSKYILTIYGCELLSNNILIF